MLLTLLLVPFLVSSTFNIFVYTTKDVSHNHIIIYIAYSVNIWIYMHKLCCLDIYFIAHRYFRSESGIVFLSCRSTFQAKMKRKLPPNLQLAGQVQYMTDFNTFKWKGSSCSRTCRLSHLSTPSSNWEKRSHLGTPLVSPKLMPLLGVVLCLVHYLDAQARSIRMKIALFRWKKQAIPGFQDIL